MILAAYDADFQPLSSQHEILIKKGNELLDRYQQGLAQHPTYAVIGTFGVGKTQFLYYLARQAIERGLLPLLFLAEDLFSEIIRTDQVFTPKDLASLAEKKIDKALAVLFGKDCTKDEIHRDLCAILDPQGSGNLIIDAIIEKYSGVQGLTPRVILLVDELEGQYRTLQERVHTPGDRSPLRELFEARLLQGTPYLKFFALAPAGIYEMGGADQTRAIRFTVPAADVDYIRKNLVPSAGRANSCWWLSRGKARHLFKACHLLRGLPRNLNASQVARIIREELDQIGQSPTEVPAAMTEGVPASKLPFMLDLAPTSGGPQRCYHIDVRSLNEGQLAESMGDAFGLNTDVSLLLAEYFRLTGMTLSDEEYRAFVPDNELPDLLALSLDHLLEYEYGNPILVQHMGDVLALYERFASDPGAVHGTIGRLWENAQSEVLLPLSLSEVRRTFPFPLMNPIVRGHSPSEMKQKWEGMGLPLWKWEKNGTTCWFFASARDYSRYLDSDEFVSAVLPDGESVLCLFPPDEVPEVENGLALWCRRSGKLGIVQLPQLLADFLASGTGDLSESIPGDLDTHFREWTEDQSDFLMSRKARVYSEALEELVRSATPKGRRFCKDMPPDAETVWGGTQISDRAVVVSSLAIAWADLNLEQRGSLAHLRDLFKSGKEGKSTGDLNKMVLPGIPWVNA